MRTLAVCFGILLLTSTTPALAQDATSDFSIRVFTGTDTEPPTTPTLLSADVISPTQIDIVWSVATDNFILSGYIIERSTGSSSTSTIATTTLTSFSDTGLLASTSYTYSVRAFDSFGNYSTSSNSLTATTTNFPVTLPSEPTEQTAARVVADEVVVTPDKTAANFSILSAFPARFEIRWGRTNSYEMGFVASDILRRNYQTVITGLEPGTRYQYEIIGYTQAGFSNVVTQGTFRTLDDFDLTAPANVKWFQALTNSSNVDLRWELPDDDDVAYVRIVRNHLGYPTNPTDGAVVYQGTGLNTTDVGVLALYSPAYYTAFVYDTSGNVSSGAIAIAFAESISSDGDVISGSGEDSQTEGGTAGTQPLEPLASTSARMPDAFDILIIQNDLEYSFGDQEATLDNDEPFLIYLDADDVTANLKSIIVQMQNPTDQRQSFSFLLRLNKDQTAYEAVIAPLRVAGKSSLVLSVYDFRSLRVAEYRMDVTFADMSGELTIEDIQAGDTRLLWQFLLSILVLLLLVIWWLIAKDRDDDEDKEDAEGREKRYSTNS